MIKGVARLKVKPGNKEAFMALAREFVALNRLEAGNISYELFENTADPFIMTFIEEWEDNAALERHLASEHFLRLAPQMTALQEGPTQAETYLNTGA